MNLRSLYAVLAVAIALVGAPVVAETYSVPPHLESVPLPNKVVFRKPADTVPPEWVKFLGAWGSDPKFHRPTILVVTRVRDNGRADVVFGMGESPRFPVWSKKYQAKIQGSTLTFKEDNRTTIQFTLDGRDLRYRWSRGGEIVGTDFQRFSLRAK